MGFCLPRHIYPCEVMNWSDCCIHAATSDTMIHRNTPWRWTLQVMSGLIACLLMVARAMYINCEGMSRFRMIKSHNNIFRNIFLMINFLEYIFYYFHFYLLLTFELRQSRPTPFGGGLRLLEAICYGF